MDTKKSKSKVKVDKCCSELSNKVLLLEEQLFSMNKIVEKLKIRAGL